MKNGAIVFTRVLTSKAPGVIFFEISLSSLIFSTDLNSIYLLDSAKAAGGGSRYFGKTPEFVISETDIIDSIERLVLL